MLILLICGKSDHLYTILSIDEHCDTDLTGLFQMHKRMTNANCRGSPFTFLIGFLLKIHLHPEPNSSEIYNRTFASLINSNSYNSIQTLSKD